MGSPGAPAPVQPAPASLRRWISFALRPFSASSQIVLVQISTFTRFLVYKIALALTQGIAAAAICEC
jgi:hypothetical protein